MPTQLECAVQALPSVCTRISFITAEVLTAVVTVVALGVDGPLLHRLAMKANTSKGVSLSRVKWVFLQLKVRQLWLSLLLIMAAISISLLTCIDKKKLVRLI